MISLKMGVKFAVSVNVVKNMVSIITCKNSENELHST